jgi:hypothetical protein
LKSTGSESSLPIGWRWGWRISVAHNLREESKRKEIIFTYRIVNIYIKSELVLSVRNILRQTKKDSIDIT